jgi:glycosyltransferase involved in cell wall biosynthesis
MHGRSIAEMSRPGQLDTRPTKVAHLTTTDQSLRFLLLAQLRAVRDAGGEAIGVSAPGPWVEQLEREGIRHVALPASTRAMSPLADARAARQLWRVLREERPDVLHVHNPKPGVYGRVVGRLARVPIIVHTMHGLYATETDPWPKRAVVYGLEAIAARCSDAELVQNPEDLELLKRFHLSPRARFLGNGVDLTRFDPQRHSKVEVCEMRRSLSAGEGTIVVGTVGRLVAEKGYPELFEAYSRLDPERFVLVVAGEEDPDKPDALTAATLAQARALGVRLVGQRDDVEVLYAAMDMFVLASHREGFPRAAMEAAATGVPVVATDVRGCRQVVDQERNGLLVPVRDPTALADAIRRIGDRAELRTRMGAASREIACARFDERVVVRRVLDTYREVAAAKGKTLRLGESA